MIEFVVKKTTELSDDEIVQICSLFESVFAEHNKSIKNFKEQFFNTALGFSLHGLMIADGVYVGAHTLIPCHYNMNCEDKLIAFSVDTMIKKGYRDFFNFQDLIESTEQEALKYGIDFLFCFPNEHSYPLMNKGLKYRDMGNMNIYVLPYKIGALNKKFRGLNFLSKLISHIAVSVGRLFINNDQVIEYTVDKNRDLYNNYRLKWFGGEYIVHKIADCTFIYRLAVYKGIHTLFLLDVDKISKKNFLRIIDYIVRTERGKFDIIMYVGYLHFTPLPLIKVPHNKEPKKFYFISKQIDNHNNLNKNIFDIENWNVNLFCYDLI